MSSTGTEKKMGDLHELPTGAPLGLRALFTLGEAVIQNQVELLGSGTPSEAPDPVELLNNEGIDKPENQGDMIDRYSEQKDGVEEVTSNFERKDDGVTVRTAGIGAVVTDAYDAIDESVGDLNDKIDASHGQQELITDETGCYWKLPNGTVNDLFNGLWETLGTVHDEVSNVSDQAAAEAVNIDDDEPTYTPTDTNTNPGGGGGGAPSGSYPDTGSGGGVTPVSGAGPSTATPEDYAAYTGSTTVDQAIEEALDALGITDPEARENWKRGYLVLIERESSGDPNTVNNWDSNAAAGQNSRGLTQTIPATFESYHVEGTSTDIHDPTANVAASMNYVMDRYDVAKDGSNLQTAVQQTDPSRPARGY